MLQKGNYIIKSPALALIEKQSVFQTEKIFAFIKNSPYFYAQKTPDFWSITILRSEGRGFHALSKSETFTSYHKQNLWNLDKFQMS